MKTRVFYEDETQQKLKYMLPSTNLNFNSFVNICYIFRPY